MNFSHFLNKGCYKGDRLISFGFTEKENCYLLKQPFENTDFNIEVKVSAVEITAFLFEKETGDKYVLLDVASAKGAFVGDIRDRVNCFMGSIFQQCFECEDIKEKYVKFIKREFSVTGENPWDDEAEVFRAGNNKWFGLLMRPTFKKLGLDSDEPVWCVNLKADSDKIPGLVNHKTIFPAWHMNKKYWITVILTAVTDFEQLCQLTRRSYDLVSGKKK